MRLKDLIDTLWNVKAGASAGICDCVLDLIDTLWNVKTSEAVAKINKIRFNRYIVECKARN